MIHAFFKRRGVTTALLSRLSSASLTAIGYFISRPTSHLAKGRTMAYKWGDHMSQGGTECRNQIRSEGTTYCAIDGPGGPYFWGDHRRRDRANSFLHVSTMRRSLIAQFITSPQVMINFDLYAAINQRTNNQELAGLT